METIEKEDDDTGLKSLIDLSESCPKFLRPQLDQLFGACIDVYKNTNKEDAWRHLGMISRKMSIKNNFSTQVFET